MIAVGSRRLCTGTEPCSAAIRARGPTLQSYSACCVRRWRRWWLVHLIVVILHLAIAVRQVIVLEVDLERTCLGLSHRHAHALVLEPKTHSHSSSARSIVLFRVKRELYALQ